MTQHKTVSRVNGIAAMILLGFVIIGCAAKDDLPPIYPIGSVNIELADQSEDMGYFFKGTIEFDINTKVRGLRADIEEKHNQIVAKVTEQISAMTSSEIDVDGDSEVSEEELAALSEKLLVPANELLDKPGITAINFENAEIKSVAAIGMGDEE